MSHAFEKHSVLDVPIYPRICVLTSDWCPNLATGSEMTLAEDLHDIFRCDQDRKFSSDFLPQRAQPISSTSLHSYSPHILDTFILYLMSDDPI